MLIDYLNKLACRINVFKEELIVNFLRQEYDAPKIVEMREMCERHIQYSELADEISASASADGEKSPGIPWNGIQAQPLKAGVLKLDPARARGLSHEIHLFSQIKSPMPVAETGWSTQKFDSMD